MIQNKKTIIKLSYDIVSPWSYLAYEILKRYRNEWNFELILNPIWLGAIMIGSGNTPPMRVPNKVEYHHPKNFPTNTLYLMRLLRIIQKLSPDKLEKSTDKLYEAMFITRKPLEDLSKTKSILTDLINSSVLEDYITLSTQEESKRSMRESAEELVKNGAFGFPWIEVIKPNGDQLHVFGSDRFEFLANWLGVKWLGPSFNQTHFQSKL
ncbi:thioredoxin-like protein [Melampsora americana]|nr:thioredoxin-like protein [Melampsora americana]